MIVWWDGRFLGVLGLADRPRPEAAETLARLKRQGLRHLVMLTGDHERTARAIAREIGLSGVHAGLLPEEKVQVVRVLLNRYGAVGMVGDGVNDAPAMAAATLGIAMGTSGTDVALETAGEALMADDLSKLPFAFALGKAARRIIRRNLGFSLAVIGILVPFTLLGWTGIGVAITLHETSTLLVVANALRLLRFSTEEER